MITCTADLSGISKILCALWTDNALRIIAESWSYVVVIKSYSRVT